jgi:hypothetical protein
MSVLPSDLIFYGSANSPDVDGSTTGGAIATATSITFSDLTSTGALTYFSSAAADTATILTVSGRDATGAIQTEAKTLTTPQIGVAGSQSYERLMKMVVSGTGATGDVAALSSSTVVTGTAQGATAATSTASAQLTLQSGQGASVAVGQILRITNNLPAGAQYQMRRIIALSGDVVTVNRDWGTVPSSASTYDVRRGMLAEQAPNTITQVRRPFYNVSSDVTGGSTRTYFEKVFAANTNAATALTSASIQKIVDPSSGTLDFALETTLGGAGSVANRQTVPSSGITSFSSGAAPQTIVVQGTGNLAPASASPQGVWLRLTLTAGLAAAKTSETMQIIGSTT